MPTLADDDRDRVCKEDDFLRDFSDATVLLDDREVLVIDADPTGSGDDRYIRDHRREHRPLSRRLEG